MTNANKKIRRLVSGAIYGPVNSRRFGVSLGINLSGDGKFCSFNCPYCFRGFNDARPDKEVFFQGLHKPEKIVAELKEFMNRYPGKIEDWTLAGNAEPTDYPRFVEIVESLLQMRQQHWPDIKVSILTNAMGTIPRIRSDYQAIHAAINALDRSCIKLDAGVERTWRLLAAPACRVTLEEWLNATQTLERPIIQTMCVQGRIDNTTLPELTELAKCYHKICPKEVHLYTVDKKPADSRLKSVPPKELLQIEQKLQKLCKNISIKAF